MAVHVMLDLETLGKTPGSAIRSIGAIVFDPFTGAMGDTFYVNVSQASCEDFGLTVDPETVEWWARQSQAAQDALVGNQQSLGVAIAALEAFWRGHSADRIWAHSPDFDVSILNAACRAIGIRTPWKYTASRCTRTIYELAGVTPDRKEGVHHSALDDARRQAEAVCLAYRKLRLAKAPTGPWRWTPAIALLCAAVGVSAATITAAGHPGPALLVTLTLPAAAWRAARGRWL